MPGPDQLYETPDAGPPDKLILVVAHVNTLPALDDAVGGVVLLVTLTAVDVTHPPLLAVTVYVPPPEPTAFSELTPEIMELPPGAVHV